MLWNLFAKSSFSGRRPKSFVRPEVQELEDRTLLNGATLFPDLSPGGNSTGTTAPVTVASPGNQSDSAGDAVSLQILGSDATGGTLFYAATDLPPGLAIDLTTGLVSGTLARGGFYQTTVMATDGVYSADQTFAWDVSSPVAVTGPGDQTSSEGDAVSLQVEATNAGSGTLSYSATGLPDGLGIDASTGLISGTISAGAAAAGPFATTVTATDGVYSGSRSFTWTVIGPLSVINPGDQADNEGAAVSLQVQATALGGGTLTYWAAGLPDGLSIDPDTGLISGTIAAGAGENGPFKTTVAASNGEAEARQSFTWIVTGPVTVTNPGDQANPAGTAVALQIQASHSGGRGLSYSASGLPTGLHINTDTGLISGVIRADAEADGIFVTTVTARQGDSAAHQAFTWQVTNPVTLTSPGEQSNDEGDTVSLQLEGTSATGATLAWSAEGLPDGLSISASTGLISGTIATGAEVDSVFVTTVTASPGSSVARRTFIWRVACPLTLIRPDDQESSTGDEVSLQVEAADSRGASLTYSALGLPDGLGIDASTGVISGTVGDSGSYRTTITVASGTLSLQRTFNWTVRGPVAITAPGDQASHEGDTVALQVRATDAAGSTLTYSATGLPDGLAIDSASGLISGTLGIGSTADGLFQVTITTTDGTYTDRQSFTWSVSSPVTITPPGEKTSTEGDAITLQVEAADAHGGILAYSATGLPNGLTIDPDTGLISGTVSPNAAADGPFITTVSATDGTFTGQQTFTWNVRSPITITDPGEQRNTEGDVVSLQFQASDTHPGIITYSATGLPDGLRIHPTMGVVTGTISAGAAAHGPFTTTVAATDGTFTGRRTFTWNVPPPVVLTSVADQSDGEGDAVALQIQGSGGGGSLTYFALDLPAGLAIDPDTGLISGTIGAGASADGPFTALVLASDGSSSAELTFTWNVSTPVTITTPQDQRSAEGATISLQIQASDAAGGSLTYAVAGLPDGLNIDPDTGLISGTISPGAAANGPFTVTITATDGAHAARRTFGWVVTIPPTLTVPTDRSNDVGDMVTLAVAASGGGTLTYSANGLPAGLTIDPANGFISGTVSTAGTYEPTITVSDGTASASGSFHWAVNATPPPGPVMVMNPGTQNSTVGAVVSLQVFATNMAGGTLTYSATGLPDGLSINSVTGLISGTIAAEAAAHGPFTTTVTATDGTNTGQQRFTWTVTSPVTVVNPGTQTGTEGNAVSLQIQATDSQPSTLTYSATGLPNGLSINASTGLISGTVSAGAMLAGPFTATVTASDGTYIGSQTFTWLVLEGTTQATAGPVTVLSPGNQSSTEGEAVSLQILAIGSSGSTLTYSATGLPTGLAINSATGLISGTLSTGAAAHGPWSVTVTAGDGTSSGQQTFTWNVSPAGGVTPPGPGGNSGDPPPGGGTGDSSGTTPQSNVPPGPAATTPGSPASSTGADTTTQVTSGGYHRHYTHQGSNSTGEFYLDVTIDSTFSLSGPGNSATTVETGTVSYTAWLELSGDVVYDVSEVVPLNSSIATSSGFSYLGVPAGGAAVSGYNLAAFGFDFTGWDHENWQDSLTFNATGTYLEANGVPYQFVNRYASNSWWTSDRTWTPGADVGTGTEVVVKTYGGSYTSDITTGDGGNFPAGAVQYDTNGYPTTLVAAPAQGTTFLARSFDSQTYGGNSRITKVYVGVGELPQTTGVEHSTYAGVSGYRYYFSDTLKSGDRNSTSNPSTDTETWLIEYQWTGDYSGGRDAEITGVGLFGSSGTVTTKWKNSGKVLTDTCDYTDVYYRNSSGVQQEGTYRFRRDNNGSTATYKNEETRKQVYGDNARLTLDHLTYRYEQSGGGRVSSNDQATFTVTAYDANSVKVGQATGWRYAASVITAYARMVSAGSADILKKTGTVDNSANSNGSVVSLLACSATHTAADGSSKWTLTSSGFGIGISSANSNAKGDYNADGAQTSGKSYSHSQSSSRGVGQTVSKEQPRNAPVRTTTALAFSNSTSNTTADVSFDGDGTANGTIKGNANDTLDLDTTVTLIGARKITDGTVTVNDRDHRHTTSTNRRSIDLSLLAGLGTGTVTADRGVKITYDFRTDHKTDLDNDKLHAWLAADGDGTLKTTDEVTTTFTGGKAKSDRVFVFTQNGMTGGFLAANGNLSDTAGHEGTWTLRATFWFSVNDKLREKSGRKGLGWDVSEVTFKIDEESRKTSKFKQTDNGLGWPAFEPGRVGSRSHELRISSNSRSETLIQGWPTLFTFDLDRHGSQGRTETTDESWSRPALGEAHSGNNYTRIYQALDESHLGINEDGRINELDYLVRTESKEIHKYTDVNDSPHYWSETHQETFLWQREDRWGSTVNPYWVRTITTRNVFWWKDKTDGGGIITHGDPNPPSHTVEMRPPSSQEITTWSVLWDDFRRDPAVGWLYQNGSDVLRIAGGAFDVGVGIAMSLGSGGLAVIPGVGLMAVGIDQIITGVVNIGTGQRGPSVFEFGGYSGAQGLGFNEGTSQTIGAFTPLALSLAFAGGGFWLGGVRGGRPLALVHLTDDAGLAGINATDQIAVRTGIFAVPADVTGKSTFWKVFWTGLAPSRTANAVPIPQAALALFRRPIPIGPFSAWKFLGRTYFAPGGAISTATGAFTASSSLIGPGLLIYGPDLLFWLGAGTAGGLYWYAYSLESN